MSNHSRIGRQGSYLPLVSAAALPARAGRHRLRPPAGRVTPEQARGVGVGIGAAVLLVATIVGPSLPGGAG